mmetsp:Transcript_37004/g.42062  ORF Transcript_37004/g.42062 Transcript_37004/m.42062 type:complete len:471 (-) Transcript_37004:67-1479(-)
MKFSSTVLLLIGIVAVFSCGCSGRSHSSVRQYGLQSANHQDSSAHNMLDLNSNESGHSFLAKKRSESQKETERPENDPEIRSEPDPEIDDPADSLLPPQPQFERALSADDARDRILEEERRKEQDRLEAKQERREMKQLRKLAGEERRLERMTQKLLPAPKKGRREDLENATDGSECSLDNPGFTDACKESDEYVEALNCLSFILLRNPSSQGMTAIASLSEAPNRVLVAQKRYDSPTVNLKNIYDEIKKFDPSKKPKTAIHHCLSVAPENVQQVVKGLPNKVKVIDGEYGVHPEMKIYDHLQKSLEPDWKEEPKKEWTIGTAIPACRVCSHVYQMTLEKTPDVVYSGFKWDSDWADLGRQAGKWTPPIFLKKDDGDGLSKLRERLAKAYGKKPTDINFDDGEEYQPKPKKSKKDVEKKEKKKTKKREPEPSYHLTGVKHAEMKSKKQIKAESKRKRDRADKRSVVFDQE